LVNEAIIGARISPPVAVRWSSPPLLARDAGISEQGGMVSRLWSWAYWVSQGQVLINCRMQQAGLAALEQWHRRSLQILASGIPAARLGRCRRHAAETADLVAVLRQELPNGQAA